MSTTSSLRNVIAGLAIVTAPALLPVPAGAAADDEAPASTDVETSPDGSTSLPAGTGPAIGSVEFVDEFTGGDDPLQDPGGVAVGLDGRVYVAEVAADRIRVFDREGLPLTSWGERGGEPGQLRCQQGDVAWCSVAVGPDGSVYVVDTFNHRIQKFTPDGELITTWGEFGSDDGQFNTPMSAFVDAEGQVFVVEDANARVQVFDEDGTFVRSFGGPAAADGHLDEPFGVARTLDGTFLVTDAGEILRYDADGAFLGPFELDVDEIPHGQFAFGVMVDGAGNVYLQDVQTDRQWIVGPDGSLLAAWGETGSGPGQFTVPAGFALDPAVGAFYITDSTGRVQVFHLDEPFAPAPN